MLERTRLRWAVTRLSDAIEGLQRALQGRVRLLAWLLLVFSSVFIAASIYLLSYELKGPITDVPLAAAGPCKPGAQWGKGRLSQSALWRTGDDRFALRSLDSTACYEFALPQGGSAFLVMDAGGAAYQYTVKAIDGGDDVAATVSPVAQSNEARVFYRVKGGPGSRIRVSAENADGGSVTLRQIFAAHDQRATLSSWNRDAISGLTERLFYIYNLKYVAGLLLLCGVVVCSCVVLASRTPQRFVLAALSFATLSLFNNTIGFHFSGDLPHTDFLSFILDLPINNGNLYYTIDAVNSLHRGVIDGSVLTSYRKPLYFLMAYLFSVVGGGAAGNFILLYASICVMQIAFHVVCFFALSYALARSLRPLAAALASGFLATLSISSNYVQVDTNIVSLWYVLVACLLIYCRAKPSGGIARWGALIGFHLVFAALAFFRSEWFILWIFGSIILHWREARLMVLPISILGLFLIAQGYLFYLGTGEYKIKISSENVGHVAFVGLWQNDFHPFHWEPTDASYDEWISAHGYTYGTEAANEFAQPEVIRFYFTFPVYTVAQASKKLLGYFGNRGWTSTQDRYSLFPERPNWLSDILHILFILSLGYVLIDRSSFALSLCIPVLISLPMFCLLQMSGGRFTTYITETIILSATLLLAERWPALTARTNLRRNVVVAASLALAFFALPALVLTGVKAYPDLMLAAPFLDPHESTLYRLR